MSKILLIGLATLFGLAGCFSLSRNEPRQQHYVLGDGQFRQAETLSQDGEGIMIGIRRLQLAEYLETPFVVVRRGDHRITFSEYHRWGEQLGGGINRAVAANLTSRASIRSVNVAPWPAGERYDYLVQLNVLRFEGIAPAEPAGEVGEARMLATWEIIRHQDGSVADRGTTNYQQQGWIIGDYFSLVTSLNAALNALSDDIALSLEQLVAQRPASLSTR